MRHRTSITVMPKDLNSQNTLFGGKIWSELDLCGSAAANKMIKEQNSPAKFVFVVSSDVQFFNPAIQGDIIYIFARVIKVGKTSIKVRATMSLYEQNTKAEYIATGTFDYVAMTDKDTKIEHNLEIPKMHP